MLIINFSTFNHWVNFIITILANKKREVNLPYFGEGGFSLNKLGINHRGWVWT